MDKKKIEMAIQSLLIALGEDPAREGLRDTPKRVARFYEEWLSWDKGDLNHTAFTATYDEIVAVSNIPFYSLCEHHVLPFFGRAHIGYIPNGKVLGLSKLVRVLNQFSRRLQVQEQLTEQVAEEIIRQVRPKGVMVVLESEHMCMSMRGVRTAGAMTTTSCARGVFLEHTNTRQEFLSLIKRT